MPKQFHEIRDPIHVFIRLTTDERQVLDSRPFQRLRDIHQLSLTYLIYPGATHRRFEHSLGVMELGTRIYDVLTAQDNLTDDIRRLLPEIGDDYQRTYWRRVLRMAALCHDMGHLPFSHAAEKELLPEGWNHEQLTRAVILDGELADRLYRMKLQPLDIVKLALGPNEAPDLEFSAWETILAEIIVGDAFGADRMDYLLRDSHHAGVAYGRFDHYRLIDTLRILPTPPAGPAAEATASGEPPASAAPEPALGVQEGGLHSAEALMLARFFMFTQLYFHPVRRAYDIHLKDFLKEWLPGGLHSTEVARHLQMTDVEVTAAIRAASRDANAAGHDAAQRIAGRGHFRLLYQRHPEDVKLNPEAGQAVFEAAKREFGEQHLRWDRKPPKGGAPEFPVQTKDGRIASSMAISETLNRVPVASFDYVLVNPDIQDRTRTWLEANRQGIIQRPGGD